VPVVVVFTKCDALLAMAFGKLNSDERKLAREEQLMKVKEYAKQMLRDSTAWEKLKIRKYPPKDYVHLENMHKSDDGCQALLERTANSLNEEAMQMLLISTQHSNMLLCIKYCVERVILPCVAQKHGSMLPFSTEEQKGLFFSTGLWFPHTKEKELLWLLGGLEEELLLERKRDRERNQLMNNLDETTMVSQMTSEYSKDSIPSKAHLIPFGAWKQAVRAGVDAALILEHSFFLHQQKIQNPIATAAEEYESSGVSAKVVKALPKFYAQYKPQEEKGKEMSQLLVNLISEHIISKHVSK